MNSVERKAYISKFWEDYWIRNVLKSGFEAELSGFAVSWHPELGFF